MKKLSKLVKPVGLITLLLTCIAVIVVSCKKNSGQNESDDLADLQKWEAKNFNHNALLFNSLKPDWNKVFINEQENQQVYEVEVINKEKLFLSMGLVDPSKADSIASKSKIKMLFFKDKRSGQITDGYYMVSIADDNPHYKKYSSLTGAVYYYGANGNFINGYIYEGGNAISAIKGANAESYKASLNERSRLRGIGRGKLQLAAVQTCYTDVSPVYGMSCITVETYTECTPYVKGYNYTTVCTDVPVVGDGGGVGGGGSGSGGSGGGSGSGSGGGTAPSAPDITNELKDYPCAQELVEKMKTLNTDIANLIKNTFGKNDLVNINFKPEPSLVGTITDGKNLSAATAGPTATYQIGINPDVLNKSTKEYILATLYHEALHAYFAEKKRQLANQPGEFERQFLGIEVNGGRLLQVQDQDHWPMGYDKFLRGIKDAILAYNPSFDVDRAIAIAKGGIISLNPAEDKVNKQERDTTNPNNPGATGTKCGSEN